MTISINRLRKFQSDADAAIAALRASGERVRLAKKDVQYATDALREFNDSRHHTRPRMNWAPPVYPQDHQNGGQHAILEGQEDLAGLERQHTRLEAALAAAQGGLAAAEAARADSYERHQLAISLARRGREYAASLGLLPADMKEI